MITIDSAESLTTAAKGGEVIITGGFINDLVLESADLTGAIFEGVQISNSL